MSVTSTSGLQPLQFAPRALAVGGGAEHLDVGFQPEQRRQRAAHHRLVFGQQHTDHRRRISAANRRPHGSKRACLARGRTSRDWRACIVRRCVAGRQRQARLDARAAAGAESTRRRPPSASMRSRMPLRPLPGAIAPPRPSSTIAQHDLVAVDVERRRCADARARMALDVGHRLAQGQREHGFQFRRQRHVGASVVTERDAVRIPAAAAPRPVRRRGRRRGCR